MSVYHQDETVTVHHGDCLDVLAALPDSSVDAVVTDPPYGLANTTPAQVAETITRWVNGERDFLPGGAGFMGKSWDAFVPPVAVWDECLRVLKPGGHVLAFAGSRTHDLMTLGLRLAGFDIRDSVAWLYGSGFPKSLDVSKAIDKAAGAERATYTRPAFGGTFSDDNGTTYGSAIDGTPITLDAERWQGWGTALKPAFEPVVMARKPFPGTVAGNVLEHGTGALNIDECRVSHDEPEVVERHRETTAASTAGRWPANVVLDESQAAALDEMSGESVSNVRVSEDHDAQGDTFSLGRTGTTPRGHMDSGGASRFFYVAKADQSERIRINGTAHPTVKPLTIMRWLVRLITPPGGTVLEPFAGSGTTVEACILENLNCIAIEREPDYLPLIRQRINRRRDPVQAIKTTGDDPGLFDLLEGEPA